MPDHSVDSDGARIHYSKVGSGPNLLLIPGGGGDGTRYAGVAAALSDGFTVLSMDRRCCGQSSGDRAQTFDADTQARDALAVISAEGGRSHVFGNSGGGIVALRLAENHAQALETAVIHEPPCLPVLPDAAQWIAETDRIEATYRAAGPMAAMMQFIAHIEGVEGPPPGPKPNPRDIDYFLDRELHHICRVSPDCEKLRQGGVRLVLAAGRESGAAYYVRTAQAIAAATGAPCVEFAGHHFAHAADPARYAKDIRAALAAVDPS